LSNCPWETAMCRLFSKYINVEGQAIPNVVYRLAHNVCVSAVVPLRSRVLSHETKTLNEDKTLNQPVTAPLQKHTVSNMCPLPLCFSVRPYIIVKVAQNRIDCHGTWSTVFYSFVHCPWVTLYIVYLRGGQP
jgi:hypothetical protein